MCEGPWHVEDIYFPEAQPTEDLNLGPSAVKLAQRLVQNGLPENTFALHIVYR